MKSFIFILSLVYGELHTHHMKKNLEHMQQSRQGRVIQKCNKQLRNNYWDSRKARKTTQPLSLLSHQFNQFNRPSKSLWDFEVFCLQKYHKQCRDITKLCEITALFVALGRQASKPHKTQRAVFSFIQHIIHHTIQLLIHQWKKKQFQQFKKTNKRLSQT